MLQVFPSERSMNIQADDASTVNGDVARGSSKSRAMLKRQSKGKKQGTFNTAQNNTALPSILFSSYAKPTRKDLVAFMHIPKVLLAWSTSIYLNDTY
jgi:hypothetical protein